MEHISARIRIRRDTAAAYVAAGLIPEDGEPVFEKDTRLQRIGDGVTPVAGLDAAAFVDAETLQLGDDVRARIAQNIADPSTPEGAAIAELIAASVPSAPLAYDPGTGLYSAPDGSALTYDPASGLYSMN